MYQIPYHDHYRAYWSPPVGPYSNSLMGMLGAIGMTLETDKGTYKVGEPVIYRVRGAIPGSQIVWSSWKNGQPTGEYQASYGDTVDANGTAEITSSAFTDADKGQWQKIVLVLKPDGSYDVSNTVSFSVTAPTAQPGTQPPVNSGSFLDGDIELPIIGSVPKIGALIGAGALAYFLIKGRR